MQRRFHFRWSLFCVDLCRLLLDISALQTFSVQRFLHSRDRFLNDFWFLLHRFRDISELWKFGKVSLCSLQPRNPEWIVLLNHIGFKGFPKGPFHAELEYRTKSIDFFSSNGAQSYRRMPLRNLAPIPRCLCFANC